MKRVTEQIGKTVEEAINELYNKYGPQAVEQEDSNEV